MRPRPLPRPVVAIAAVVVLAVLAGCVAQAASAPRGPAIPLFVQDKRDDVRDVLSDALLARLLNETEPGCSAAVAVRGQVLWAGAGGLADVAHRAPVTVATRFDMASVSKQFTATAILMLQREGKLKLDDPIATYVDGLPAWGRTVTLDQLMHHTSHVRDYWQRLDALGIGFADHVTQAETIRAIAELPTLEPGSGYLYSNSNYVLLAELVRRVSGEKLPDFLEERVFAPLHLAMELHPNLRTADVALSYDDDGSHQVSGWSAFGAVGIFTTPSELARWADQYREGTIVQDDFEVGAVTGDGKGVKYAAGIELRPDGSLRHDGRFAGDITTFQISPDRETAIVVMCNGHTAPRFPIADALWKIWDA